MSRTFDMPLPDAYPAAAIAARDREQLLDLLESMPDALLMVDSSGRVADSNARARAMFGYSAGELEGKSIGALMPERLRESHLGHLRDHLARSRRHAGTVLELCAARKDGSELPIEVSLSRRRAPGGSLVLACIRDITKRKRAQRAMEESVKSTHEAFRESEERARLVIDSALDAFVATDAGGAVIEWNKRAQIVFGWSREEVMGRPLAETIIPERYRESHARGVERVIRTGKGESLGRRIQLTGLHREGREFPVELEICAHRIGGVYFFGGFIRDITERLKLQQVLRESESGLRRAQGIAKLAHMVTRPDGSFDSRSESLAQLLGTPIAIDTRGWIQMIHGDDRARVRAIAIAAARDGKRVDFGYRLVRADGGIVDIRHVAEPMTDSADAAQTRWFSTLQDVTEERRSAADLVESELRFRQLADNISEVFFLVDPERTRTFYVSPAYESIWGRTCESLYADPKSSANAIHAEDRERVMNAFATAKGESFNVEYRIVRPDGAVRSIRSRGFPIRDDSGEVYRIAGIAEDVTDQRRTQDELLESERRFKGMLANIELASVMLDVEGRITYCNEYMLRLTGWNLGEVLGRGFIEVFVPSDVGHIKQIFADLLADKPSAWHHENEIATRSGERRLIQWNNSVLRSAPGAVIGSASIGEDITERRHAEWEVLRLNANLERRVAERTAELQAANKELETFDYSISHDLRAPLSRIRGFGAALLEDFGDKLGPEGRVFVDRINDAGKQMDQLVDDLLQLSTVTCNDLHRTEADVSGLARSVLDNLLKADPARDVTVVVEAGLTARADVGLLRIVLENLLGNAWKFTARRASARIELGRTAVQEQDAFFVKDNGAGFDASKASKLFEPFRRQHSQGEFKGTGIGLATVQRIVRRHGGSAWAEGAVDQGATFYFTLPR